ncbi:MAG: hypothetical protein BWY82_01103 [Verrucomicrobia bacterium ADurb.Bin474]|nr:MAG: hypothetical protein BWY82_01103 [Verrucomicrobia bacterium ADurb.Bin474]
MNVPLERSRPLIPKKKVGNDKCIRLRYPVNQRIENLLVHLTLQSLRIPNRLIHQQPHIVWRDQNPITGDTRPGESLPLGRNPHRKQHRENDHGQYHNPLQPPFFPQEFPYHNASFPVIAISGKTNPLQAQPTICLPRSL